MMDSSDCDMPVRPMPNKTESLFERWSWFYALCREYLFRDHTEEITRSLFPQGNPATGSRLLELGCGPGFYACKLSEEQPQLRTTGVDLSHSLIRRAESRAAARQLSNCSFQHADAHSLPYSSASIDFVVVSRLFLIVPEKEGIVREIFRVLRPEGRCFIAEPTSGFRTRIPLAVMWLLARLTTSPAGKYREPQQAEVMSHADFSELIQSQQWGSVNLHYDGWYQYAVCERGEAAVRDVKCLDRPTLEFQTQGHGRVIERMSYRILNPAADRITPLGAATCALAIMAKAPRAGKVKTRLSPPLTLAQTAALNVCFLRDTSANLAAVDGTQGLVCYTPVGEEGAFTGVLPESFALIAQREGDFGERLLAAATDILGCGFAAVCLIDSDSPTVPHAAFVQAVTLLAQPGDRVVLGPSHDGGYYLIGLKQAHAAPFTGIAWSTEAVADQTRERCHEAGLELVELPLWYDVDDGTTLEILSDELLNNRRPEFAAMDGYKAPETRGFLLDLDPPDQVVFQPGQSLA